MQMSPRRLYTIVLALSQAMPARFKKMQTIMLQVNQEKKPAQCAALLRQHMQMMQNRMHIIHKKMYRKMPQMSAMQKPGKH